MTNKQERKVREKAYKHYDEVIYEHQDWNKRDIALSSFYAGAEYALANKYDELKEDNTKPNIVQFLKTRGVYEMFMNNLFNQKTNEYIQKFMIESFNEIESISDAFLWGNTSEGIDFWAEINNMWIKRF